MEILLYSMHENFHRFKSIKVDSFTSLAQHLQYCMFPDLQDIPIFILLHISLKFIFLNPELRNLFPKKMPYQQGPCRRLTFNFLPTCFESMSIGLTLRSGNKYGILWGPLNQIKCNSSKRSSAEYNIIEILHA